MKSLVLSGLMAICIGLFAVASLPGSAHATEGSLEYRIIGCAGAGPIPGFPGGPEELSYNVIFSSIQDEVGLPCETVLNSIGDQGFRLIEVRPQGDPFVGILHYLERRRDG